MYDEEEEEEEEGKRTERRHAVQAFTSLGVDLCARVQQQLYALICPRASCHHERGRSRGLYPCVHIQTVLEQQLDRVLPSPA